jgi:hypothetical protein
MGVIEGYEGELIGSKNASRLLAYDPKLPNLSAANALYAAPDWLGLRSTGDRQPL